ncbi:MAG: hypothetical protein M3N19_04055 [Candidatus Eremiobacteraeota bacterium]|nr:hypothetical protein [Candidatus Eremiobacteraeota bacterium]
MPLGSFGRIAAVCGFVLVALASGGMTASAAEVSTLAGSGALGMADGPAQTATFIFPSGVAVARDSTIYIADRDAQRIRAISPSGNVRTVAGTGALAAPMNMVVTGSYKDGPARQAGFYGPMGLAIGPDGALYIADSGNSVIRKLQNGTVTTVLGKAGDHTAVDGTVETARLVHPFGLAFDATGNLYISDFGGGLRMWSTQGVLSTIHLKSWVDPKFAFGITYVPGDDPSVILMTRDGAFVYHINTGKDDGYAGRNTSEGNLPDGVPFGAAYLGKREILYTDIVYSSINYFRLPAPPFLGQVFVRRIAGGTFERSFLNSGFANGTRKESRFYGPMGIAVAGNVAIIADSGNRRIRKVVLPHARVSESGLDPANQTDDQHYEVALVGASWSYFDSLGDNDSICAHIEMTLDRSHRFKKPVRCHTVRIDAGYHNAIEDYARNVFPYQRMDLVILDSESWYYNYAKTVLPGGTTTNAEAYRSTMEGLLKIFTPMGTKLGLVTAYNPTDISSNEWVSPDPGIYRSPPSTHAHDIFQSMVPALKGLPIMQYDIFDDEVKYQKSVSAPQLYQGIDPHPNPYGNAFLGDHFAQGMLDAGLGLK